MCAKSDYIFNDPLHKCKCLIAIIKDKESDFGIKSSSSYRAGSTDIPDPLSPLLPIVHRPR